LASNNEVPGSVPPLRLTVLLQAFGTLSSLVDLQVSIFALALKQANMMEMVDSLSCHNFYGSRLGLASREMKV